MILRATRGAYLDLLGLTDGYGLCNFCKFSDFEGDCDASYLNCKHPLPVINGDIDEEHTSNVWGSHHDCWGFRPSTPLREVGEFVGICLEGKSPVYNQKGELGYLVV